jgi:hypothetical protein
MSVRQLDCADIKVDCVVLPDDSAFFIGEISDEPLIGPINPICWNPWNKVVQDHRDGTIHHDLTNAERSKRGLTVPWTPDLGVIECHQAPIR